MSPARIYGFDKILEHVIATTLKIVFFVYAFIFKLHFFFGNFSLQNDRCKEE